MSADVRIETERLVLREIERADFDAIHRYATDPEVIRYVLFGPNTPEETHAFIDQCIANRQATPRVQHDLAMTLRGTGELIGACGIGDTEGNAEMGYVLHRDHWGNGYMTEVAGALIDFGFGTLGLHRIYAYCDVNNTGSYRVMEKNAMRREGRREEAVMMHDTWRTVYDYAILRREWRERTG